MKEEIVEAEEKLRKAMLSGDAALLDTLIDDALVFVAPDGELVTKQMDLEAHSSKTQRLASLSFSKQDIRLEEDCAIVVAAADLAGTFDGADISGKYRYLRIWTKRSGVWKVIAGAATPIQN